ncbi:MAG TPA: hypothetical protein VF463_19920 [Sphingobium sp.]
MTRVIINGCLEEGCTNDGGLSLLCPEHAPGYAPALRVLNLPVKGIYFDQIRDGTKSHEYRLITDFWRARIVDREYDRVVLTRGYPKAGGIGGQTRLTREWRGHHVETLTHPHFGPLPVTVFAIDVSAPHTDMEKPS